MISEGARRPRAGGEMPCEGCSVQFSVFRRKRTCAECERLYCSACLRRGGGVCAPCRALSTRPLTRAAVAHLKVRDLQCFLQRQNVSTRGCVEKEELVSLCVSHVNSVSYRRRGARAGGGAGGGGAFTTLKGLTNNFNEFLNSAFDLRAPSQSGSTHSNSSCFNTSHVHTPAHDAPAQRERFTTTPGGERDISVSVPVPECASPSDSTTSARVDTTDCFEVEDLEDAGWEVVTKPAAPLPNDSEVLMAATEEGRSPVSLGGLRGGSPQRASSELELRRSPSAGSAASPDSASLHDELLGDADPESSVPLSLEALTSESALSSLNVKQLKELLARNRVEYRGCLERADLLERARTLYRDHRKYKDEVDNLPLEECCKICMAAPLECVLLECGHMAACTRCGKQLAECPICRQYVVRAVRVFRS